MRKGEEGEKDKGVGPSRRAGKGGKARRGRKAINLPNGRLKTLAALTK